jgi:hypothetical protein
MIINSVFTLLLTSDSLSKDVVVKHMMLFVAKSIHSGPLLLISNNNRSQTKISLVCQALR